MFFLVRYIILIIGFLFLKYQLTRLDEYLSRELQLILAALVLAWVATMWKAKK